MSRRKDKKAQKKAESGRVYGVRLGDDESLVLIGHPSLAIVWPKYLLTLGLYHLWRKRNVLVLTDHRVVSGKGIFSRTERSMGMNHIEGATYQRKGFSGYSAVDATVRGRHETLRLGPLSAKKARDFTEEIVSRT